MFGVLVDVGVLVEVGVVDSDHDLDQFTDLFNAFCSSSLRHAKFRAK